MGWTRRCGAHLYVAGVVENDNVLERLCWEKETLNGKHKAGLSAAQAVTHSIHDDLLSNLPGSRAKP